MGHMNAVGVVAVIALGMVCMAQAWGLHRLLTHFLGLRASQYPPHPARAAERRSADFGDMRLRHPSEWPTQGDVDGR